MIDELASIVDVFPGAANRTQCFAHILNLVVKCIMKQFDVPSKNMKQIMLAAVTDMLQQDTDEDGDANESGCKGAEGETGKKESDDEDNVGTDDSREGMSAVEIEDLEETVKPVQCILTKVSCLSKQTVYNYSLVPTSPSFEKRPM